MSNMSKWKFLKVRADGHGIIEKAAKRHDCSMGDIAIGSVKFVYKNRYNPFDLTDMAVVDEVRKMKDQLVAYIQKQEKNLLRPLSASVFPLHIN